MNRKRILRTLLFPAALALCLAAVSAAPAEGGWTALTEDRQAADGAVRDETYSGTVTVTFLGDCTLGGEEKSRNSALGFVRRVQENGTGFPLRNLTALTLTDDLTVANLEGVLTDRPLEKVKKKYNFSGPTVYTQILTSGGGECVTLANNHSRDYGDAGYADTKAALEEAGVGWFGTDAPAFWQNEEGLRIGFIGVGTSLSGNRYKRYVRQMKTLREAGCAAVVTVMHAGTEYSYTPDSYQEQIVSRAVSSGTDLVIGHHPHVVQGYAERDGVPVVYSLGNCSFGGTTHAKDSDALVVQADLTFEEGLLADVSLRFYPISITSDGHYNNYSPMFLSGADAERVIRKMERSTGVPVAASFPGD